MDASSDSSAGKVMVCLVGEQNAPNLIPILHYKPAEVALVYSDYTWPTTRNLQSALQCPAHLCPVEGYDIQKARQAITDLIESHKWQPDQLIFNLTGGTKLMSIAGYIAAHDVDGCRLIYLRTDRKRSECYQYTLRGRTFMPDPPEPITIGAVLTLDLYLRSQGLTNWRESRPKNDFERLVADALKGNVSEMKIGLGDPSKTADLDLLVRCDNQVAAIEIKAWATINNMEGMKQLSTYASPSSLGTYARRILVGSRRPQPNIEGFASALRIPIIVLPSFEQSKGQSLSDDHRAMLVSQVREALLGTSV